MVTLKKIGMLGGMSWEFNEISNTITDHVYDNYL